MRHLGSEPRLIKDNAKWIQTVLYDEDKVLHWINENAKFSRQTVYLNLCDYTDEERLKNVYQEMDRLSKSLDGLLFCKKLFEEFLEEILPSHYVVGYRLVNVRKRGLLPWINVPSYHIESLQKLYSLKNLSCGKSEEIAYRTIFSKAMIKMELFGRKWFIDDGIYREFCILMPASICSTG